MITIELIGRLTADPEHKTATNGNTVCTFNLACDRKVRGNGDKQTDFYRINVWGKHGDSCAKYLHKGNLIYTRGELQPRIYDAKNGEKRMALDVEADHVTFLQLNPKPETVKENSDGYDKTPQDDWQPVQDKLPWDK